MTVLYAAFQILHVLAVCGQHLICKIRIVGVVFVNVPCKQVIQAGIANKLNELEEMLVSGEIHAPLATEDGDILLTESDDVIEAFWYYATK